MSFAYLKAQVVSDLELRGDMEFKAGNYQAAWNYYNEAVRHDSATVALWWKMGESAKEYFNYNTAFQCYRIVAAKRIREKIIPKHFSDGRTVAQYRRLSDGESLLFIVS